MSPPIEAALKETERTMAAFLSMKGPYSLMGEASDRLYGWGRAKGYRASGPPSIFYSNAPATGSGGIWGKKRYIRQ